MSDLATIAERVWKAVPECRPSCNLQTVERFGFVYDAQSGAKGVSCPPDIAELLIIGACVKHNRGLWTLKNQYKNTWSAMHQFKSSEIVTDAPTQAIALLLACEELSKKESPRE